jgi:cytochrome P450
MGGSLTATFGADPARLRRRPPAPWPRRTPLSQLGLLRELRRNPINTWHEAHFTLPIVAGEGLLGHVSVLCDPKAIRHVLVDNAANYRKDDLQRRVLTPGLGEGLLTAEGDLWRRTRRTLAPVFTPRRVESFAAGMARIAGEAADRLVQAGDAPVDMAIEMTRVTFDVLSETLFSDALAGEASAFNTELTRYFDAQGRIDPLDVLNMPEWLPRIGRLRARASIRFFEQRVSAIVAQRRAEIDAGAAPRDDLLSALITAQDPETGVGLTDGEVGANVITFIGAGHETTANTLTWALYLLSRSPDIAAVVASEAQGADMDAPATWIDTLPMTRAVIEESMRLYPPVPHLSRAAIARDQVGDVVIPRGSIVVVPPYVIHRHRLLWSSPDQFLPERFLPGARERIDRFAFLPFGAGPRVCIGLRFAMVEAVVILASMMRRFRVKYAGSAPPEPVHRITLRPKDGMPMRIKPAT